ncbi:MAG TPA: hypothetical protein VHB97_11105 [Polyangia bacterium]|nr:hypothetical protein [Polyangia bacterium]
MLFCLALAACATAAPATSSAPSASTPAPAVRSDEPARSDERARSDDDADRWKRRPGSAGCHDALLALARADLTAFRLGTCGRIDAERAFGSSGDQPSRFEQLGEYRVYSYGGNSILVWFLADNIRLMQLLYPKLSQPIATLLGAPDAKAPSQLSSAWEQWIYAGRGIAAHVKPATGEVITLFAFGPTSVAAFLETDIARVSKSEAPIEELK